MFRVSKVPGMAGVAGRIKRVTVDGSCILGLSVWCLQYTSDDRSASHEGFSATVSLPVTTTLVESLELRQHVRHVFWGATVDREHLTARIRHRL